MPIHARETLIQRMERSGQLDRLSADVRILFRKRLQFHPATMQPGDKCVSAPLRVGAVSLGYLSFSASHQVERNAAYRRWLEMAARFLAEDLSLHHPSSTDVLPTKIVQSARIIREHHRDALQLGDVASRVGLCRERLSRLFHECMGITFSDYLNQVRLSEARQLLSTADQTITEIAYASGFQSLSQFNRRFKEAEGISPSLYRKHAKARA